MASHGGISFPLAGSGGHELVQLRILGYRVDKRHQRPADPQQPMPRLGVGDIPHLRVGDMQQLPQLRPVRGRLIEQQKKLRVGQHQPGRLGFQALLYVLRGRRHGRGVLPKPLPCPVQELPGVVVLEVQIALVQEHPRVLPTPPILHHPVLDSLQRDHQSRGPKLLPHLVEVQYHNPAVHIHIAGVGEHIQAALGDQLRHQRNLPGLRVRLPQDLPAPVRQEGHGGLAPAAEIGLIDVGGTAVYDGLV